MAAPTGKNLWGAQESLSILLGLVSFPLFVFLKVQSETQKVIKSKSVTKFKRIVPLYLSQVSLNLLSE